MEKRTTLCVLVSLVILAVFAGCTQRGEVAPAPELKVALHPDQSPEAILLEKRPLADYLEEKLGMKVRLYVPTNYPSQVEALTTGMTDVAAFGGFTYVQARAQTYSYPLVTSLPTHHSVFITQKDSDIQALADLKGKTFAFGSSSSTSGNLMPRYYLLQAGIDPENDLEYRYTGKHDATAEAVQRGEVEAGVLYIRVYEKLVNQGKISEDKVRVFYTTPAFPDYPWVVRGDIDPEIAAKLKQALLDLKDEKLLEVVGVQGYRATNDDEFQPIRDTAINLGFLKAPGKIDVPLSERITAEK